MNSDAILTIDNHFQELLRTAESVATSKATVLIFGESGTGKELIAKFIHAKSARCAKRFVAINCAAMPEGLIESELFGFEKGAFTSANSRKIGKLELAHGSTFLLDEISELPLLLQAKLLRVIQQSEVERLGGLDTVKIDVRWIATSNRDLTKMVKEGTFREDLFFRLNVIPLFIPPLRARPKDIEYLAEHFCDSSCSQNGILKKNLSANAIRKLIDYHWPGNVRELQNVIERGALLANGKGKVEISDVEITLPEKSSEIQNSWIRPGMKVEEMEKLLILKTLEFTGQNRTHAADLLGISVRTLRNKLAEYREEVTR